ncbi:MAG: hypothetical protein IJ773_08010, partial [Lachnospiraceae bacterium]|nr:hypothetical protein [Lachnospiraceae bacterium]
LLQCHILFSGVACPLVSGGYRFAPPATAAYVVVKCAAPKFLSPPNRCFEVGDSSAHLLKIFSRAFPSHCPCISQRKLKISQPKKKTFLAALEAYRNKENS